MFVLLMERAVSQDMPACRGTETKRGRSVLLPLVLSAGLLYHQKAAKNWLPVFASK